jgi:hypothetical protein
MAAMEKIDWSHCPLVELVATVSAVLTVGSFFGGGIFRSIAAGVKKGGSAELFRA